MELAIKLLDILFPISIGIFFGDLYFKGSVGVIPVILMGISTTLAFATVTWLLGEHFK